MLKVVSKKIERKKGFLQAQYRDKKFAVQILLHHCMPGVVLDRHKHQSLQYGYNFYGKYDFGIGNDLVHIGDGNSYLINGLVEHEALAHTEYYSIDIKFHGNMNYDKIINLPLSAQKPLELKSKKAVITIFKPKADTFIEKGSYLIVSRKQEVEIGQDIFEMEPMKLYQANDTFKMKKISSDTLKEMLVITIC